MKKALILFSHGLGDVIQLTPHLRYLYNQGMKTDLMCRKEVKESHLLDNCPYINSLITIENPWNSSLGYDKQNEENIKIFNKIKDEAYKVEKTNAYEFTGMVLHNDWDYTESKIDMTSRELGLNITDKKLEVFISTDNYDNAREYATKLFPIGHFIFVHTVIKDHPNHTWDCKEWIKDNFIDMPIWDTSIDGIYTAFLSHPNHGFISKGFTFNNINDSFALMAMSKHRILSSSVFVHAADAMGLYIDCINYGTQDRKVWPLDMTKVLRVRECGIWLDRKKWRKK